MVVLGRHNPVDLGVASDVLVGGIDHDDFVEFEGGILSNPVRVEDSEVRALAANSLFSSGLVSSLFLELSDTLVDGLTVDNTLADKSLTSSTSDADSVDNVSLSSLVTELSGLIGARGTLALGDDGELSELPGLDSHHKSEKIRLLASPHLFQILVATHNELIK